MIEEFARHIPPALWNESGKAFHSGRLAFSGQRDLYVLGFNPGGAPDLNKEETVADNADLVLRREPENWSAFCDEVWKPGGKPCPPGKAPLQKEMQTMICDIGLDIREVPISDSIFVRSAQAKHIETEQRRLMELCWPFHRAVIDRLGVRVVLCMFKPVAEFLRMKTGAYPKPVDRVFQDSKSGKTRYWRECFAAPGGLKIVQITRPTGVAWTDNACILVKRALGGNA